MALIGVLKEACVSGIFNSACKNLILAFSNRSLGVRDYYKRKVAY